MSILLGALPRARRLVACATAAWLAGSVGACTHGGGSSGFSDGSGFGVVAQKAQKPAGQGDPTLRSANWDVAVDLGPGTASVSEKPDSWTVSNQDQSTIDKGQFLFLVLRNDNLSGAAPRAVAGVLRDDDEQKGLKVSEIQDTELLGQPGAMYASVQKDGSMTVTLLTVSGSCVYVLNVSRVGDHDSLVDYLGAVLGTIHTYSGAALSAPACR
jgi:hypothetical protein